MNRALLQRLVPNTLAAATEGRQRADVGPFALFVSEASDDPIQSFAVPVAPAPDWRPAVAELQQAFDAAGRRFRIEFFRELHPALSPTLYAMGYEREMEAPLMILHRDAYRPAPDGPARLLAAEDEAALDGLMLVQHEAFDQPLDAAGAADFRARLRQGLARGSRRAALVRLDGIPARERAAADRRRHGRAGRGGHPAGLPPPRPGRGGVPPAARRLFRRRRDGLAVRRGGGGAPLCQAGISPGRHPIEFRKPEGRHEQQEDERGGASRPIPWSPDGRDGHRGRADDRSSQRDAGARPPAIRWRWAIPNSPGW